jgi:hypothetical protein
MEERGAYAVAIGFEFMRSTSRGPVNGAPSAGKL